MQSGRQSCAVTLFTKYFIMDEAVTARSRYLSWLTRSSLAPLGSLGIHRHRSTLHERLDWQKLVRGHLPALNGTVLPKAFGSGRGWRETVPLA